MTTCPTCPPSSLVAARGVLGIAPPGGRFDSSRLPAINVYAPIAASRVALRGVARSGLMSTECSDVLCRNVAAIIRLEGRESKSGVEVGTGLNWITKATLRPSWRGSRGGCVSFHDLALWRLRLKLGLPCLDLASEAKKSLDHDDKRSMLELGLGERLQLGSVADSCKKVRISVPEALIFFIAYHTAASHHVVRGPCGKACACSWGMSTLPTLLVLGRSYYR
ncbi:hypothetical protein B296_00005626 [Ensete ventricosum]|uniref:Uncharacterized protein n=1 Tax=Ensete ventricosum TaxID=4639 RepID=A0A427AM57_ENSVE|nr:hypothetical protein B296_00005626 [Ensete ventricosum]